MAAAATRTRIDVPGVLRPAGTLDVATALEPFAGALDDRKAAHLLRRAGFGGSPSDIAALRGSSAAEAVERLVHFSPVSAPPPSGVFDPATLLEQYGPRGLRALGADQRRELFKQVRKSEFRSILALQLWWLNRMLSTPAPLQEKMTFFFHGHFTTAAVQKGVSPPMVLAQNQLFRSFALGNLRELTRAVSRDPAMLLYLDNATNVAAHPNENYARELMELFTLGVDQFGEEDVRQSARAWTGWRVRRFVGTAFFDPALHDDGTKTFLGQTGNFDGDDVVDIIFAQPQCARFFASALLSLFVYDAAEPALVDRVAALLRAHDYELAPVVATILRSNVFYSERAYRALVKSPVEFVIGAHKSLGLASVQRSALPALRNMGQILFYPPNVAGWPGGENWLTSQMMIARQNFLAGLANVQGEQTQTWLDGLAMEPSAAARALVANILHGDVSASARAQLESYLGGAGVSAIAMLNAENFPERIHGAAYLTMAMPAYQLA
jgi:uncharacterized protein (DUF1800 family)